MTKNFFGIRRLSCEDKPALEAHFHSLDECDYRSRFGGALNKEILKKIVHNWNLENSIGFFKWGKLQAVALMLDTKDTQTLELGISCESSLKGRGVGTQLVYLALDLAQAKNKKRVQVSYDRQNLAIAKISSKFPGKLEMVGPDCLKEIELDNWSPLEFNLNIIEQEY